MPRLIAILLVALAVALPSVGSAATLAEIVRGRILLDVEGHGEAWYVYPPTGLRYYLGRPADAFAIMRGLGLGITDADLAKIPVAGAIGEGDLALRRRLSGRILLQVQQHGEAWYVHPPTLQRHYLGRPDDAFAIMRELGLGITQANLAKVPIATASAVPPGGVSHSYRSFTHVNARGSFTVRLVTLKRADFEMVTDTAGPFDCERDCPARPLADFVAEHQAFAGIHGTYFCPPDYEPCAGKINTFLPPVFNTALDLMVNEDGLRHFKRPMLVQMADRTMRYFHRADADFGDSVAEFELENGPIRAAIGNWPSLVEGGRVVVEDEPMEAGFLVKGTRGAIGWNGESFFLAVISGATVPDIAHVLDDLGAEYAMNLDGGGTVALHYDGAYRVGPGRALPNAIVFRRR